MAVFFMNACQSVKDEQLNSRVLNTTDIETIEVAGCVYSLNVEQESGKYIQQRMELDIPFKEGAKIHEATGSAQVELAEKEFDITAGFQYEVTKFRENTDAIDTVSRLTARINGLSSVAEEVLHVNLHIYREGAFVPMEDGSLKDFSWSPNTMEMIDKNTPEYYLFYFCTPKYRQLQVEREDTVYFK